MNPWVLASLLVLGYFGLLALGVYAGMADHKAGRYDEDDGQGPRLN